MLACYGTSIKAIMEGVRKLMGEFHVSNSVAVDFPRNEETMEHLGCTPRRSDTSQSIVVINRHILAAMLEFM